MEEEVDAWCDTLKEEHLQTLKHPYQTIAHWHEHGGQEYTYNDEAKQDYRLFANEMSMMVNTSLDKNVLNSAHVSKDKRTMVR